MACQKALDTFELLEGILMLLPHPDIFRMQTVCRRWHGVICSSSAIQETLFLKPAKHEIDWLAEIINLPAQIRPLNRYYLTKVHVKAAVTVNSKEWQEHHNLIATPVRINPFCLTDSQSPKTVDIDAAVNNTIPTSIRLGFKDFGKHGQGSWAKMLVTQPPTRYLTVEVRLSGDARDNDTILREVNHFASRRRFKFLSEKIYEEGGVRVSHIAQAVEKMTDLEVPERIEVYIHGMVAADEDQESVVRKRTEEWRKSHSNSSA